MRMRPKADAPDRPEDGEPTPAELVWARIAQRPDYNPPDWESWAAELDRLAWDIYGPGGAVKNWGYDTARQYFVDGDSPSEAIASDMEYWGD